MFEATRMLFIYVETPLHAGTGRGLGAVDLPIQRERTTGYPIVQASSIKGRLRAEAESKIGQGITADEVKAIFGPKTGPGKEDNPSDHAGSLSTGDARILLFPVRSLAGVFAWVTSVDALARFQREAALVKLSPAWTLPAELNKEEALVNGDALKAGNSIVLEEFSFTPKQDKAAEAIGTWLATYALPQTPEYNYWREALPKKLCILPEDAFRDFALYGTEVQTHVRLDPEKKTVQQGALWTSESLPVDTLLYSPLMATKSRNEVKLSATEILKKVSDLNLSRTQLGGDETTGQGMVALRITRGEK
ncbi:MAG: type III-B CRISPR module RAMP protein Cmr4 [Candidatus Binatia bacterium]